MIKLLELNENIVNYLEYIVGGENEMEKLVIGLDAVATAELIHNVGIVCLKFNKSYQFGALIVYSAIIEKHNMAVKN